VEDALPEGWQAFRPHRIAHIGFQEKGGGRLLRLRECAPRLREAHGRSTASATNPRAATGPTSAVGMPPPAHLPCAAGSPCPSPIAALSQIADTLCIELQPGVGRWDR
jgi:hypothetical protein